MTHLLLIFLKGFGVVSLTTMRQSVKTLFIYIDYKVDIVVELLQCFPKLENLSIEVMILRNVHTVVLLPFQNVYVKFDWSGYIHTYISFSMDAKYFQPFMYFLGMVDVSFWKNVWRHRHRQFLKHHDICLKTVSLEDYVRSGSYADFAMFLVQRIWRPWPLSLPPLPQSSRECFMKSNKGFWSGIEGLLNVHVLDYHQVAAMRVHI